VATYVVAMQTVAVLGLDQVIPFDLAYPDIDVDPDVLYVDNGRVLTSAGATAGLVLCLHMIRRDYGSAAADAARLSVMPLEREGGQAQFIVHEHPGPPAGRRSSRSCAGWKTTPSETSRSTTSPHTPV
jgi:hypothetical protein